MFSGVGGSFASGLNQSLMEWQRIWLEEEKLERADQREGERLAFEEWRVEQENERQRIANKHADNRWTAEQLAEYHAQQMDFFRETVSPFSQMNIAQVMAEEKNPWASIAMDSINTSIVQDPLKAAEIVNEIYNPQNLEYRPLIPAVRQAATMTGMGDGLSGDALQDYVDGVVADAEARSKEGADMQALAVTDRATQSQQMYQNLQNSKLEGEALQSQIANQEALTKRLYQQMGFDEELHPINVEAAAAGVQQMVAQTAEILQGTRFSAEIHPEVMRGLMYDNDGKLLSNEIQAEIRTYIVEQARAQAEEAGYSATIAGAIAEHAFQSAALDVALKEGNVAAIAQQLEIGIKQMTNMDLSNERLGMENEEYRQVMKENRIGTFTTLMASGHVDLAKEYAGQYLDGIVSEDALPRIIETMEERANLQLSEEEARLMANTTVAFYEEQYAQEMAELRAREARAAVMTGEINAENRQALIDSQLASDEVQRDLARSNIAVAQGTLALQRAEYNRKINEGESVPSPNEVMKAIKAGTGLDMSDVTSAMQGYHVITADIAEQRRVLNDAIKNWTSQSASAIEKLTGQTVRNAQDAANLLTSLESGWQSQIEESSRDAQHVISTIFNWADWNGVPLSAQMFGLDEKDYGIYFNAVQNNPAYRHVDNVPESQRSTVAEVANFLDAASYGQSPLDITLHGASALFDELTADEDSAAAMSAMGYNEPADLQRDMVLSSREYEENMGVASQLAELKGYDLSSSDTRQRAIADVNSNIQSGRTMVNGLGGYGQLSDADQQTLKQNALQWLAANGRELSFAEEVMYGPGDIIHAIEQINSQLSTGAAALNWLAPRMAAQEAKQ